MPIPSLQWRYAVKRFDADRKIPEDVWQILVDSLVLTPSSFGLQPWKFIVVQTPELREKLVEASWKQSQPRDCSHLIVFAGCVEVSEDYVDRFVRSIQEVRGVTAESLYVYRRIILDYLAAREGAHFDWSSKQVYIALGQLLTVAAMHRVDACPLEGIEPLKYDEILGLNNTPYRTVVGCALGYRHPLDGYATNKKVRFPASSVIEYR